MRFTPLTPRPAGDRTRHAALGLALLIGSVGLGGCSVLAIADVAASAVIGVGGLAVDAAVGTAKIGGKIIGKTADAVLGADPVPTE